MKIYILIGVVMGLLLGCGRAEVSAPLTADTEERNSPTLPSEPSPGVDVGSGGDSYAGEFVEIGYEIVEHLIHQPMAELRAEDLLTAIKSTKVTSKDNLELDGKPIDAINYAHTNPPRIEMSRTGWDRIRMQRHEKVFLVLHEYLGILKRDHRYELSRRIDRASVCRRTEAIRVYLENEFRKSCYRITVDDLRFVRSLNLANKGIGELNPGDFYYFYELEELSLHNNALKGIPRGLFRDLGSLRKLDLSYNQIEQIQPYAFQGLSKLLGLSLYKNNIATLGEAAFDGLVVEQIGFAALYEGSYISLGLNSIRRLERHAFRGLSAKNIDLSGGALINIENGAFLGVKELKRFGVSLNVEGAFYEDSFQGLESVEELSLNLTGNGYLRTNPFSRLQSLRKLHSTFWNAAKLTMEHWATVNIFPALDEASFSFYGKKIAQQRIISDGLRNFHCEVPYSTSMSCIRNR